MAGELNGRFLFSASARSARKSWPTRPEISSGRPARLSLGARRRPAITRRGKRCCGTEDKSPADARHAPRTRKQKKKTQRKKTTSPEGRAGNGPPEPRNRARPVTHRSPITRRKTSDRKHLDPSCRRNHALPSNSGPVGGASVIRARCATRPAYHGSAPR